MNPPRPRLLLALVATTAALTLAGPARARNEGWPGFRGRTGSGVTAEAIDPAGLAPAVVWRVAIGSGYSGVAVADGKAFTMFEDGDQYIAAFDAASGEELWRRRIGAAFPGRDGSLDGPVSTPVVHDGLVVALEPRGRLVALDADSGETSWSVHLAHDLGAPRPAYGFGSSPLVVDGALVVHGGGAAGTVLGFDVATGEALWSVGKESVVAPSPVALTIAGRTTVVASGAERIFGIDASGGRVLWAYSHQGNGYRGQGSLVPVGLGDDRVFLAHDDDASQVIGLRPEGDGIVAERVWLERTIRNSYNVAVHHEGFLYAYSARVLVCVEAATGELRWRSRAPGDGFITLAGATMVILTKDGSLHAVRATPEGYEELASATIFDELTWTPPSVAQGDVFARSLAELVRIDLHGGDGPSAATQVRFHVPRSLDPGEGEFGRFVRAVETAAEPAPLIDAFLADHPELPLIEGDTLVHFVYRGADRVMGIAGDHIGARQEAPMVRVGATDLFYYSTRILPEARISYVFVRESETIRDPRNPLGTETLIYDADWEFSTTGRPLPVSDLRMPRWDLPRHLREPDPAALGTVEPLAVSSRALGEVTFQVYLPHGYGSSEERYPVVYYHGPTPRELSAVPRSLDNLIADGALRPVIAIFSETALPPTSAYTRLWADELVPAVDAGYRTIADAGGRVGVGGDLGSLHATFIAFERPHMTSGLGLHSVAFLDSDWAALEPILTTAAERPLRIYLDWGSYSMRNPQEGWDLRTESRRYRQELERLGFTPSGGEAPDGDGWASWRNRADDMLRALIMEAE
jgi:outer membrane protein assembly factor BamB/enterochelin esterase-like enzyme